jgi:hypothetical protein
MRGAIRARKVQNDADLALAYMVAAFNGAGRVGKLKPLAHYQSRMNRGRVAQTPKEMLSVFHQLKSRGAPMKIERIVRKPV